MTKQEALRLQELKQLLTPFFGVIAFKGSKAQRKNAEKELRKLEAKHLLEIEEEKRQIREKIKSLEEERESISKTLDNLPKFWWEIHGITYRRDLWDRWTEISQEISHLITRL